MLLARAEQHGKPHPVQDQIGNYVAARDVSGIDRVDKWSPLLREYRIWLIAVDSFFILRSTTVSVVNNLGAPHPSADKSPWMSWDYRRLVGKFKEHRQLAGKYTRNYAALCR